MPTRSPAPARPFKAGKRELALYSPARTGESIRAWRLPVSLRIVLESVLRNCDGLQTADHVTQLANWQPGARRTAEIPFVVSRVVLRDSPAYRCCPPTWPRCATSPAGLAGPGSSSTLVPVGSGGGPAGDDRPLCRKERPTLNA